jgi:hypothetical protein
MFRIVLQPEEQAILRGISERSLPVSGIPGPVLLGLMALRMLVCDEHGHPKLTELAEAALARMDGRIH